MAILIESEKVTPISDENYGICYFAIKDTHRSLPGIDNIFSLAKTMEKFLNILEAPRQQQQQDNFDVEKTSTSAPEFLYGIFMVSHKLFI